ncbi:MAG TPA: DnaJ domain-containing protein [Ktedonosporobacter sp.]|nr:DnaJ domain-containing protein [Ktedonosporobacter sp.]
MEPFIDYYAILGVPSDASLETIKKAFRQLAKEHHPDVNKSQQSRERFIAITNAYAVLSDPLQRHSFDLERASHSHLDDTLHPTSSLSTTDRHVDIFSRRQSEVASLAVGLDEDAYEMEQFGTLVAARMQTIQAMLDTFTEARAWSYPDAVPTVSWRLPLYRALRLTLLVLFLLLVVPLAGFKLYLNTFHPLPSLSDLQLTTPGVGVTFSAHLYGQQGNIQARFYDDGQLIDVQTVGVSTFLPSDAPSVKITSDAYAPYMLGTNGTIKLYWCFSPDCTKEQLLQSLTFPIHTITPSP